nr:MAG TPA: hypothetical protein [Caudoviricetes sp.]
MKNQPISILHNQTGCFLYNQPNVFRKTPLCPAMVL